MVTGDGAAIKVQSQEVGGEEKRRRGEERREDERRVFWVLLEKWVCSAKHVGANRIFLNIYILHSN